MKSGKFVAKPSKLSKINFPRIFTVDKVEPIFIVVPEKMSCELIPIFMIPAFI